MSDFMTYGEQSDVEIPSDWLCIFGSDSLDDRTSMRIWKERLQDNPKGCATIGVLNNGVADVLLNKKSYKIQFYDLTSLTILFSQHNHVLIDLTGLEYAVWVSLLQVALQECEDVYVLYAEPSEYRVHSSPATWEWFDLSKKFLGVKPLPGFANIMNETESGVLVTFIGFEGRRSRQITSPFDPIPKILPIVGLPGFRIEYPTYTIACNRDFIDEQRAFGNVRYAPSHHPFGAFELLERIQHEYRKERMFIALIGTRPHSLAAILFAMRHRDTTEVLYDHPIRSPGRTKGIGPIHIYRIKQSGCLWYD